MLKAQKDLSEVIQQALDAIDSELEAVRSLPSREWLYNGQKKTDRGQFVYGFETNQLGLRFADQVKARFQGQNKANSAEQDKEGWKSVEILEFKDGVIWIEFDKDFGIEIDRVEVEWENDFVWIKLREQLELLQEQQASSKKNEQSIALLEQMLDLDKGPLHHEEIIQTADLGRFNPSQRQAIQLAMHQPILYIWGPPGTGKTASIGRMVAEYLRQGKKVLMVSNTNRAVDVSLLSVLQSISEIGLHQHSASVSRFGESWLDDERLVEHSFEAQMEKELQERIHRAAQWDSLLHRYEQAQDTVDHLMDKDEPIPNALEQECQELGKRVDDAGGVAFLEQEVERLSTMNERHELKKRNLVATTLAKVCTSELFFGLKFDAVVVDEASMANLGFLLVMASKAKSHVIITGDPMQLPPIAITEDVEARAFLEQDIFTWVADAQDSSQLFEWHDQYPNNTAFFDTQYRLQSDLAGVISKVFYEGRLKSEQLGLQPENSGELDAWFQASVALVNTGKYSPELIQDKSERGFRPVNEVHQRVMMESVERLLKKYDASEIGLIVPFRYSVYQYRTALRESILPGALGIEVGTIHTFQGREKEAIILDTIMTAEIQYGKRRDYSVRPFDETKNGMAVPRLLNVACTRSKKLLVIIADMNHMKKVYRGNFMARFLNALSEISL